MRAALLRPAIRVLFGLLLLLPAGFGPALAQYPAVDPVRGVMTMAPLVERATPAVVNISVTSHVSVAENPLFRDPFFRRFFDIPDQPRERETLAAGSGVIVDARQGLVVTNYHVTENAEQITVTLKDRREFKAQLVGRDPGTDIALLRIRADNLTELPFGDSDQLKVGDLVLAIGNPFGLGQTVTSGIISALGRTGITSDRYEDFIQTDAPINPGNSGGALIDTKGELIGINTAIIAPGGGNVGIGFAVPSNIVKTVMGQLLHYGGVRRGRIGVVIQDLTPELAQAAGSPSQNGALVAEVEPDSSAAQAGLRPGDIIVGVDGVPIRSGTDLSNRIALTEPDHDLELTYLRNGERRTAEVAVSAARPAAEGTAAMAALRGAEFADIPQDHPAYDAVEGAYVARVARGSPAAAFGLRPGDIILGVNREPVSSPADLQDRLRQSGRRVALDILRGDTRLRLIIR